MTFADLRRQLELAGDAVSPADHELRRQLREQGVGADWMFETDPTSPPAPAAAQQRRP